MHFAQQSQVQRARAQAGLAEASLEKILEVLATLGGGGLAARHGSEGTKALVLAAARPNLLGVGSVSFGLSFGIFGQDDGPMDTWGISAGGFVLVYVYLLGVTLLVALKRRRRISAGRAAEADTVDQYELAMLNGGPRLVAAVALVNLDRDGSVELGDRLLRELAVAHDLDLEAGALSPERLAELGLDLQVTLAGPLPLHAHPVEKAAYRAVETSGSRRPASVVEAAARVAAVNELRARLVTRGLLIGPSQRAFLRRRWRWFLPLGLLVVVRLGYELQRGRPILALLGLLVATVVAMAVVRRPVPERTTAGSAVLQDARHERPELAAGPEPLDRQHAGALLALAGAGALWTVDPPLAVALDAGTEDAGVWSDDHYRAELGSTWAWPGWGGGSGCGGVAGGGCGGSGGCGGGGGGGGGGGCGGGCGG